MSSPSQILYYYYRKGGFYKIKAQREAILKENQKAQEAEEAKGFFHNPIAEIVHSKKMHGPPQHELHVAKMNNVVDDLVNVCFTCSWLN